MARKLALPANLAFPLVLLAASSSMCLIAYDANLLGDLNIVPQYTEYFGLGPSLLGLNLAIICAGQVVGGPIAGPLLDRFGRRSGLMLSSFMILVSGIIQTTSTTEAQFVVGRFVLGLALGIAQTAAPAWVMELAPAHTRNLLVSIMISAVTLSGVVSSGLVLGFLENQSTWSWRAGLMGELVAAALSLILLPWLDESPRWLAYKGRKEEALEIIARLHARGNSEDPLVVKEFQEITSTLEYEKTQQGTWRGLIYPFSHLKRFLIAVLCQIFYQFCGSNSLINFFPVILQAAGVSQPRTIIIFIICLFGANFTFIPVGGLLTNRFGSKQLLLSGTSVMTLALIVLAVLSRQSEKLGEEGKSYGIGAIVVVAIFQVASSCTWIHLNYSYSLEVLKYSQRAKGMTLAQAIGFAFSFLNIYTIPIAINTISWIYYVINAGWNVLIILTIFFFFVETKGKTLEEMDQLFDPQSAGEQRSWTIISGQDIELNRQTTLNGTPELEAVVEKKL